MDGTKNGHYFMLHSLYPLVYKKAHKKCQICIFYQKLKDCLLLWLLFKVLNIF